MMGDLWVYLLTQLCVHQFLTKPTWPPSPTLPIHLFSPWGTAPYTPEEKLLKGKCFADVQEMKQKMVEALKSIKINEFKNCFEQQKKRLERHIASSGEYCEGDRNLSNGATMGTTVIEQQ